MDLINFNVNKLVLYIHSDWQLIYLHSWKTIVPKHKFTLTFVYMFLLCPSIICFTYNQITIYKTRTENEQQFSCHVNNVYELELSKQWAWIGRKKRANTDYTMNESWINHVKHVKVADCVCIKSIPSAFLIQSIWISHSTPDDFSNIFNSKNNMWYRQWSAMVFASSWLIISIDQ